MNEQIGQINNFYLKAFQQFDAKRATPLVEIEFYPYVGLRHTIRLREGRVFVRLSDLTTTAPLEIHQALAFILVAKLLRRRVPKNADEIYRNYATHPEIGAEANKSRQKRGRKMITSAAGAAYDLETIFSKLNKTYFENRLEKPILSWSKTKTRRIFGHQDAIHNTVIISKTLDDARIPQFVVEFVLYHELLHIVHPTKVVNGKRRIHSSAFRRDERKFPHYHEAEKWLEKLAKQTSASLKRKTVK